MSLALAILFLTCVEPAYAHPLTLRWAQPDLEAGDTWEVRIEGVEFVEGWVPIEELDHFGDVHTGFVAPIAVTLRARTTRDRVTGPPSEPRKVPEPSGLLGLVCGCIVLIGLRGHRHGK